MRLLSRVLIGCLPWMAGAPTATPPSCAEFVWKVGRVIERLEGVRPALNNPGGLSRKGRPLRFRTRAAGETAMLRLIERLMRDRTPEQFFAVWAPDGQGYAGKASRMLRIDPKEPMRRHCY